MTPRLLLRHLKRCLFVQQTYFKGDPACGLGAVGMKSLNTPGTVVTSSSSIPKVTASGAAWGGPRRFSPLSRLIFGSLCERSVHLKPKRRILRRSCWLILLIIGTISSQIGRSFVPRARHLYAGGGRFWRLLRVHYHTGQSQKQYKVQPRRIAKPWYLPTRQHAKSQKHNILNLRRRSSREAKLIWITLRMEKPVQRQSRLVVY